MSVLLFSPFHLFRREFVCVCIHWKKDIGLRRVSKYQNGMCVYLGSLLGLVLQLGHEFAHTFHDAIDSHLFERGFLLGGFAVLG